MGRTKVKFIFESDDLSPMELVDYVKHRTASSLIEITDFEAIDYLGHDSEGTPMKGNYQLLNILDTIDGRKTTILLQLSKFKHLVIHQIGGTYDNLEDFNEKWQDSDDQVEKTVICHKCKEPVTYFTPRLDEILNYTCMETNDAKALAQAIIELTEASG